MFKCFICIAQYLRNLRFAVYTYDFVQLPTFDKGSTNFRVYINILHNAINHNTYNITRHKFKNKINYKTTEVIS